MGLLCVKEEHMSLNSMEGGGYIHYKGNMCTK